jgi:hypothetical protein
LKKGELKMGTEKTETVKSRMGKERPEIDLSQCQQLNKMYKNDMIMFLKSIKEGGKEENEEVYQHSNIKLSDFLTVLTETLANKDLSNLSKEGNSRITPAGSVIVFAGGYRELPGYFFCDGAAVSRTAYSGLFSAIGTTYGGGNGSSTFNIPDFRGMFLRGASGNAATLGTKQGDAIRNITGHQWLRWGCLVPIEEVGGAGGALNGDGWVDKQTQWHRGSACTHLSFDAARVVPTANENRPVNYAVHYYIKY